MSIKVMGTMWDRADVDGTLLLLLLALADHSNDAGICWPSIATLGRKIRRSRARTFELLATAEARGLIERQARPGKVTHYRLILPDPSSLPDGSESSDGSSLPDPYPSESSDGTRPNPRTRTVKNRHREPSTPPTPPQAGGRRRRTSRGPLRPGFSYDAAAAAREAVIESRRNRHEVDR